MTAVLRIAVSCWLGAAAALAGATELKPGKGGPAPALELRDLDGRTHRLADYRGQVVLVNFWATWCEPCRAEMPSLQRLKTRLAGRPFVVIAVNLDEPESRIRKFLGSLAVDFPVLLDPGRGAARAWNARILPASYVLGTDGTVRYAVVGELQWDGERVIRQIDALLPAAGGRSALKP